MSFMHRNQKEIRKHARDAAAYTLSGVDMTALDDKERALLTETTTRLLVKYFNGRDLDLLSQRYVIAEFADAVFESDEDFTNLLALQTAAAQMAIEFEKFIVAHDTEGKS